MSLRYCVLVLVYVFQMFCLMLPAAVFSYVHNLLRLSDVLFKTNKCSGMNIVMWVSNHVFFLLYQSVLLLPSVCCSFVAYLSCSLLGYDTT